MADPPIHIKIYSPSTIYYDGQALSLSAVNDTGPFDILARHKNFISLLKPCDIKVRLPNSQLFSLPILRGIVHAKGDQITVFLDV